MREGKIKIGDPEYPDILAKIKDPPKELYYEGDISLLSSRCVSIVGSRKSCEYGAWAAHTIAGRLAGSGITVVSGMARGIDTCAHRGALDAGGKTIAVLGTGLDVCYPAANRGLKENIARLGLLISEYPPGYPARRGTFVRRNRIISGLSEVTVVAEAGLKSGALITAEMADSEGRYVYAVPGQINSVLNMGSNMLIRDGAMPLVLIDDLLSDLGIKEEKSGIFRGLGSDEKKILSALLTGKEMDTDELCKALSMPPEKVNGLVSILEMKGVLHTAMGKIFIAK